MKNKTFVLFCLLWTLPFLASGQEKVHVWAEFDTSGWIGDALSLRLCCRSDAPEKVNFPVLHEQISQDLILLPEDSLCVENSRDAASGMAVRVHRYRFSAYKEGRYTMPAFHFEFVRNDSLLQAGTDTGAVRFFTPVVDTLQPIKGLRATFEVTGKELMREYLDRYGFWLWILLGVAFCIVAGLYVRKRLSQHKPLFIPQKPPVPPVDRAVRELEKLKEKQLWQQNRIKEYYTELTDILRMYLWKGMGIPAIEMTNDELSCALRETLAQSPEQLSALLSVLERSVLVKFAKGMPQASEHEDSFSKIAGFLRFRKAKESEKDTQEDGHPQASEEKKEAPDSK